MKNFRLYHLTFAALVCAAYFSADASRMMHSWLGYAVACAFVVRMILGFAHVSGFTFQRIWPQTASNAPKSRGINSPQVAIWLTFILTLSAVGAASTGIYMDQGQTLTARAGEQRSSDATQARAGHEAELPDANPVRGASVSRKSENRQIRKIHELLGNMVIFVIAAHILYFLIFRLKMSKFLFFIKKGK